MIRVAGVRAAFVRVQWNEPILGQEIHFVPKPPVADLLNGVLYRRLSILLDIVSLRMLPVGTLSFEYLLFEMFAEAKKACRIHFVKSHETSNRVVSDQIVNAHHVFACVVTVVTAYDVQSRSYPAVLNEESADLRHAYREFCGKHPGRELVTDFFDMPLLACKRCSEFSQCEECVLGEELTEFDDNVAFGPSWMII
ncbi:hypothetical protein Tco_0864407 [Tanacetum coccineum]